MKLESHFVDVHGLRMHYVSAGEGPAVILLHGFPDTHAVWRRQIPALVARGFRVIAPDLRGYGRTDAPAGVGAYAIEFLCADILGLMDRLGLQQASLVGHDWGGLVGWHVGRCCRQLCGCRRRHDGKAAADLLRTGCHQRPGPDGSGSPDRWPASAPKSRAAPGPE